MKNKKAEQMLSEEVVKTVITVICLVFLIFLLVSLYFAKVNSGKLAQAKDSIEIIQQTLNHMELNSLTSYTLDILAPDGWVVFGFVGNEQKPNSCNGKNCLCICKDVRDIKQSEKCSEDGACLEIIGLKDFNEFELGMKDGTPVGINLNRTGLILEVKQA